MKHPVMINGRLYDNVTGLPIDVPSAAAPAPQQPKAESRRHADHRGVTLTAVHASTRKKATTLSRRHVAQPSHVRASATAAAPVVIKRRSSPVAATAHDAPQRATLGRTSTKQSASISKFATPIAAKPAAPSSTPDKPAKTHPAVHRSRAKMPRRRAGRDLTTAITPQTAMRAAKQPAGHTHIQQPRRQPSAKELKHSAIHEALHREVATQKPHRIKKQRSGFSYWISVASAGFAVMLLGGYLTYLSMPNIAVRIAAIQSGVNASYPGYKPDGYALSGPISIKSGQVSMKFAYAGGDKTYTITQEKSNWDSNAVKAYISQQGAPTTTSVDGLTIFTNDTKTLWVNGGILYQIDTKAPLSHDQIARIASSM